MPDEAETPKGLAALPGMRLAALAGDRQVHYSIRIDDQFRICFTWEDGNADRVEIVNYH